jgi:hypothetical protein
MDEVQKTTFIDYKMDRYFTARMFHIASDGHPWNWWKYAPELQPISR